MTQPWWKQWLSYFIEFHIESTSSEYNEELNVSFSKNRYQLYTQNAIYSFGDLYDNFKESFQQIKLPPDGASVLVLGLGLGSVPLILEKNNKKAYQYTAVEIDEAVIGLTTKYTLPQLQSSMQMNCADAYLWVKSCTEKYDLIAVDLFLDDVIPAKFEQQDFLFECRHLLKDNGILLYNRLAFTEGDIKSSKQFFKNIFHPVFEQACHMDVHRNWMLLNDKQHLQPK